MASFTKSPDPAVENPYPDFPAYSRVSPVVCLVIGMAGSGKTTLVDLLLGLLEPQSGNLQINGHALQESLKELMINIRTRDSFRIEEARTNLKEVQRLLIIHEEDLLSNHLKNKWTALDFTISESVRRL